MHRPKQLVAALLLAAWCAPAAADKVCVSDKQTSCEVHQGQYFCPKTAQDCRSELVPGIPPTVKWTCPANTPTNTYSCLNTGGAIPRCSPEACVDRPPPAKVTLTAAPTMIEVGESTTVSWSATDATSCSGSFTSSTATAGSQVVTPSSPGSYWYAMTCYGPSGNDAKSVEVIVTPPRPTVTISASPTTINDGQNSTLTWSTANANSCVAEGAWSGGKSLSGSEQVWPRNFGSSPQTVTYALTCTNSAGSRTASATVTVKPSLTMSLTASPTTIERGQSTTLSWNATGMTSCNAAQGWTSNMATSGSQVVTPSPEGTYSYSMTCTGPQGSLTRTVTVTVTVPRPRVTLSADRTTISDGDEAFLSWSSQYATSCSASGTWSGSKPFSGSEGVSPRNSGSTDVTFTYTLTCTNGAGSASASVTITVKPAGSAGVCTTGSGCVCFADVNGNGSYEQNEQAACDNYNGQALCPMERAACYKPCGFCPWTCPFDGKPCTVDTGSGNYKCSKNQCIDPNSTQKEKTETHEPDTENDGPRDADGNCTGSIRIFPGAGKRCRQPGNQTAWQNCCNNKMGKLGDTTGKQGQQSQTDYKKERSSFEFWDNQCDTKDQETAMLADSGYCISLGSYCAERWPLVGCVQRANSYCCFNSLLAKLIQEQGRPQLPAMGGFGTARNPRCRGFSAEEFQALDFSKMDLSGYYSVLEHKAQSTMKQEAQDAAREKVDP